MFCYLSQNAIKTPIHRRHVLMFISPECNMNNDSSSTCSVIYRQYAIKALIYRRYVLMFIASMQYEHQSSPTCSVANIIWFNTDMSCDISLIHRKHVLMFISSMQYEHWFIADMFWCLYRQYAIWTTIHLGHGLLFIASMDPFTNDNMNCYITNKWRKLFHQYLLFIEDMSSYFSPKVFWKIDWLIDDILCMNSVSMDLFIADMPCYLSQ